MSQGALTEKEAMMLILSYIAYTDATIPIHHKTPWKIYEALNRVLSELQPEQKMVWGPAIDVSWIRSIIGLPTVTEYFVSAVSKPNTLVADLVRSNMFPELGTMLKSFRGHVSQSFLFKSFVSVSSEFAKPLLDIGVCTDTFLRAASFFSRSMMYIVKGYTNPYLDDTSKNEYAEYTVAIRGANPYSIASCYCAFDVSRQVVWKHDDVFKNLPGIAPSDNKFPCISRGMHHALGNHLKMVPRPGFGGAEMNIAEFFRREISENKGKKLKINFTGHSLGGAVGPSLALWLYEEFKKTGLAEKVEFHIYAFGAPTPGNQKFVNYIDDVFGDNCWGYINNRDVCAHMFEHNSVDNLFNLYKEAGIEPDPFSVEFIKVLKRLVKDTEYSHLKNQKPIHSEVFRDSLEDYTSQVIYQHVFSYFHAVERSIGIERVSYGKKWREFLVDIYAIMDALYDSYSTLYPFM